MKQKKWPLRLLSGGLVTAALIGVAVAAGQQGTQADPLVTLSYLQQQALPQLLADVDEKVAARQDELEDKLSAVADGYVAEVEAALGTSGGGQSGGAVYQVVELSAGQTLTASAACEILLRSGAAACVSDSSPGLVDMTDGSTLPNGGALKANHLYLATLEGRGISASTAVTLMVRGTYTIR